MARSRRPGRHGRVREAPSPGYQAGPQRGIAGVVYDSDVIIEILRRRARIVEAARALEESGVPTYCTPVSWAEVHAGIRSGEEPMTEAFFNARGEVVLDAGIGRRAGAYLARYSRSHRLELGDALIAAAASVAGLRLWTLNRKHYPMPDVLFFEG